jgi:hypothetical protein
MHEHHGLRAPQWCKLLALYEVLLHGAAQLVVYMDTDAMFVRHDMSLAEYYSSRGAARDDPFFRDVVMAPSADKALLVLSNNALNEWNTKFQHEHKFYTNSGVMFLATRPARCRPWPSGGTQTRSASTISSPSTSSRR